MEEALAATTAALSDTDTTTRHDEHLIAVAGVRLGHQFGDGGGLVAGRFVFRDNLKLTWGALDLADDAVLGIWNKGMFSSKSHARYSTAYTLLLAISWERGLGGVQPLVELPCRFPERVDRRGIRAHRLIDAPAQPRLRLRRVQGR